MAQAQALGGLDLWSSLRWRRHLRAQLRRSGDELVLRTAETTLRVPAVAEPALRRLLAGETLTVAQLGADDVEDTGRLDDTSRLELAGLLLRHAVVVPA
jgi:hypothetical protein